MSTELRINELEKKVKELTTQIEQLKNNTLADQIKADKEVEAYSHNYSTWLNTTIERDKSLLTLSVAGLGLLLTLSQTSGPKSLIFIVCILLSAIGFLISTFCLIDIFKKNKLIIEAILNNEPEWEKEYISLMLSRIDKLAFCSFLFSIVMSFLIMIFQLLSGYLNASS